MIAMAGILLTLSIAGNVVLLYFNAKKPEPRKQVGPPRTKGIIGKAHYLESVYLTRGTWYFICSCGVNKSNGTIKKEYQAVELWKEHVAIYKQFTPDGIEYDKLKKEFEEFKKNCICHNL